MRDVDAALFFHPDNERGEARLVRIRAAKAVCAQCPVRERCMDHAIESSERCGIWGLNEGERRVSTRKRILRGRRGIRPIGPTA
ncbi:WhiB family transcriptional regulator [Rhodococcus sp. DMU1]|nr:WhiB family transcriptional regulator [Rhodococcus sp. DMU1]